MSRFRDLSNWKQARLNLEELSRNALTDEMAASYADSAAECDKAIEALTLDLRNEATMALGWTPEQFLEIFA